MVRRALKLNKEWLDLQVNVPRSHCGLLMIAMNEEEFNTISEYQVKGIANGEDVRIIGKRELVKLEPNLSVVHDSVGALYSPEECLADGFLLGRFQITFLKEVQAFPNLNYYLSGAVCPSVCLSECLSAKIFFRPKWIKFANSVNRHLEFYKFKPEGLEG